MTGAHAVSWLIPVTGCSDSLRDLTASSRILLVRLVLIAVGRCLRFQPSADSIPPPAVRSPTLRVPLPLMETKDPTLTPACLEETIRLTPNDPVAHLALAERLSDQHDLSGALLHLEHGRQPLPPALLSGRIWIRWPPVCRGRNKRNQRSSHGPAATFS